LSACLAEKRLILREKRECGGAKWSAFWSELSHLRTGDGVRKELLRVKTPRGKDRQDDLLDPEAFSKSPGFRSEKLGESAKASSFVEDDRFLSREPTTAGPSTWGMGHGVKGSAAWMWPFCL
jgi:hypothetical protein